MNHLSEDKLLEYVLAIIEDESEIEAIENHLESCDDCRARLDNINKDIDAIAGVKSPIVPLPQLPAKKSFRIGGVILRAAALLLFGFLTGYIVADYTRPEPVNVSPSYLILSPPPDSAIGIVLSDATAPGIDYYRNSQANQ
jgi:predicted anti-sigma-YlaC factor YlaD